MSDRAGLILFDVDGTLVDSQGHIHAAMVIAFETVGLAAPDRRAVLSVVGLSLHRAMPVLAPDATPDDLDALERHYKDAFFELRRQSGPGESALLYPGTADMLNRLSDRSDLQLGVATGKSARGLTALIEAHGWGDLFSTRQVADFHPSKPHPSMILTAMEETGAAPSETVMIGDTTFDRDMAQAAGVPFIAVSWGYHPPEALADTKHVLKDWSELPDALQRIGMISK